MWENFGSGEQHEALIVSHEESVLSLLANINLKLVRKSPKLTNKGQVGI